MVSENTDQQTHSFFNESVGDLVVSDYRRAEVFHSFGIDFCCGGKKKLGEVCRDQKVDQDKLLAALLKIEDEQTPPPDAEIKDWSLGQLCDYIEQKHHSYVHESMPMLMEHGAKVARVHGHTNPETVQIYNKIQAMNNELKAHMHKEEMVLFPYIRQLSALKEEEPGSYPKPRPFVSNPIMVMEMEHDAAGDLLKEISALSNGHTPPEQACMTFTMLYIKLAEFEADLHRHIHLENNILFPAAIELENKLSA